MNILIIGLGSIGQRHLRNLCKLGDFNYYAYRRRGNVLPEEFEHLQIQTYNDLEVALAQGIDLCVITAPPAVQQEVLPVVVKAGCHFFVEKPIAPSLKGMGEVLKKVQEKKLKSLVGYNLRFHPVHAKIKSVLEARSLGNVTNISASVGQYLPDWHPYEDYRNGYSARKDLGGGVALDLIHEIDFVCSFFGKASEVMGMTAKLSHIEIETEDTCDLLIRFESGVIGNIHVDYVQRRPFRNGMIIGDEATLTYDLITCEVKVLYKDGSDEITYFHNYNRNDMYLEEMSALLRSIETGIDHPSNFASGLEVLEIALSAKK
jgi:predicted dehydrogenase